MKTHTTGQITVNGSSVVTESVESCLRDWESATEKERMAMIRSDKGKIRWHSGRKALRGLCCPPSIVLAISVAGHNDKAVCQMPSGRRSRQDRSWLGYKMRNIEIARLGFSSYAAYLQSDLWKSIRIQVLRRDRYECRLCGAATATEAHHTRYKPEDLAGHTINRIMSVCRPCHTLVEFDQNGQKRSPQQARAATTYRLSK